MASSPHPVFKSPEDREIKIWRYMDFTKFVHMLETSSLFFCRADCFEDPFEGSYPRFNETVRPLTYDKLPPEQQANASRQLSFYTAWARQWTTVNCWHMNNHESAAMWKLYARTNEAIAIQSTFVRLHESMDEQTHIGKVTYIDYETQWVSENNGFYPYVNKRLSFEHERELRAVYQVPMPIIGNAIDYNAKAPKGGILKPVDLTLLIEKALVAPTSPSWYLELLQNIVRRYKLTFPVMSSSLDLSPFF